MANIQSPTLIIGLGGTGVSVLRKFKQKYIELYGTDKRLVKLLALDTADQNTLKEPPLAPNEFYHLGKPQIDVAAVLAMAPEYPALAWLQGTRIPGFQISVGAGMKRFYGHIAYFFRGTDIRKKIESAVNDLMHSSRAFASEGRGAGFRVFIVSSLCGGTGTGMYLDIAYMAGDVLAKAGLGSPQTFGLLFLPSAFQELKAHNFWSSINANGYSALQELQYYMTIKQRTSTSLPTLKMPDNQTTEIELKSEPFQYCFLIGGVNEAGVPVQHSSDLYERTAEFLFMSATSNIGATLAAAAINGDQCFASFGSCNLQLPQARSLYRYFLMMGKELLNDFFGDPPLPATLPSAAELLSAVAGYNNTQNLANETAAKLEEEVFLRYSTTGANLAQTKSAIEKIIVDMKSLESRLHAALEQKATVLGQQVRQIVDRELGSLWSLEAGTIQRALAWIDAVIAELTQKRRELGGQAHMVDLDESLGSFKVSSKLSEFFTKGDARFATFKDAATSAFEARAEAALSAETARVFAAICNDLQGEREKLQTLRARRNDLIDSFDTAARTHLNDVGQSQGNRGILEGEGAPGSDDYQTDRVGLLQRCRSRQEIRSTIGAPEKAAISVSALVKALFPVVDEFVQQKAFKADFIDDHFYRRLSDAKINLQMRDVFEQPRNESYLFMNAGQDLQQSIATAISEAPEGFERPTPAEGLNPGMATFVRIVAGFKLKDLVEIPQMAKAYKAKRQGADSVYLDLPTHKNAPIIEEAGEDLGPELFAFGLLLLGILEVGQNYLLRGHRLLINDEADPVRRRKAAYQEVLTPDIRNEIEQARDRAALAMGGNAFFVPTMRAQLDSRYASVQPGDAYGELLSKEKAAAEAYLATLAAPASVGV